MSILQNYVYDVSLLEHLTKRGVYKITHVQKPELFYIGSASSYNNKKIQKGFYIRFYHHLKDLRNNKHNSKYLQNVVNKYGIEGIRFEILEIIESTDRKLILEREQYYLDTLKPVYNSSTTARCPTVPFTEERKKAISARFKGIKLPEIVYEQLRVKVYQFSKAGVLIKLHDSIEEASKLTNTDRGSISNAASGKRSSAGGYLWSFTGEVTLKVKEVLQQFDLDGNLVKTFDTVEQAMRDLKINSRNSIKSAYTGKQYQAYGFQWRKGLYVDKIEKLPVKKTPGKPIYQIDLLTDKIIKEYPNTPMAAKALNISKSSINNCVIGLCKHAHGYKWKYKE
jgi:group I intron endonuclease